MTCLMEDEVYIGAKMLLQSKGWTLVAGQPPNGCDHLPTVEVKWPKRSGIGSRGAYKPDLIAVKESVYLLIECKPNHNDADAQKLRTVLSDPDRILLLHKEIEQRRIFERHGIRCGFDAFRRGVRGGLAHSGDVFPQPDLIVIFVSGMDGAGFILPPTQPDSLLAHVLRKT